MDAIRDRYGPSGVTSYVPAYGRIGAITDDTQMTLFTAEGLIRAQQRLWDRGICNVPATVWRAYLRWLVTQVGDPALVRWDADHGESTEGWLFQQEFLHHQRAPGTTCMGALQSGHPGAIDAPINASKGCGGVMRVAPVGLIARDPFVLGCEVAALTHGHPSGYLAAGAFALAIGEIVAGKSVADAIHSAADRLDRDPAAVEVAAALRAAIDAASVGRVTPEVVESLGAGWVAEEALAIAAYCALTAADFRSGVLAAVNHGGDSDSTGAICGNLLGAALGVDAIDAELLDALEGRQVISDVADDLYATFVEQRVQPYDRYPTW